MKSRLLALGLALLPLGLSACVVVPVHESHHAPVVMVRTAPPPPPYEYRSPPPAVGFVWIDGYWNWGGARYVWVPGRWEAPRRGHYWEPRRWEHRGDHWQPYGGRWEKERRKRFRHD